MDLKRTPNSGATLFQKGDVVGDDILIEAKTMTTPRKTITFHKEWLTKNAEEAFSRGKELSVVAFDFGDDERFYVLSEQDFKSFYQSWKEVNEIDN